MIETNIRIVNFGPKLRVDTRLATLVGQHISPELKQRACHLLRRKGLASVPCPEGLLVVGTRPFQRCVIEDDDCRLEIHDSGVIKRLRFSRRQDTDLLTQLMERCLLIEIRRRRAELWTLDSPRIFYSPDPFVETDGVAAYRRFEISSVSIDETGVGLTVDVSTAFFSASTVADFFEGRRWKPEHFEALSRRQAGQKATLLYDLGHNKVKCYFDSFSDATCATTGSLRVNGVDYGSLYEYDKQTYPQLNVKPHDCVARVSFPGISRPRFVVANRLRLRLTNEGIPPALRRADKFSPADRRALIDNFWRDLGDYPLGVRNLSVTKSSWQPQEHLLTLKPPSLKFGRAEHLCANESTLGSYRSHYRGSRS